MASLAWVTARAARGHDLDEPLALAALERSGFRVDVVDWDDQSVDWGRYDQVLLRSTWDYTERLADFRIWLQSVAAITDLRNPLAMVLWSLDKHYLGELASAAVPTTPTLFVEPGERAAFPSGQFVVKPAIGAGSRDAASYTADQHPLAQEHVDRLHARGACALVQPLLSSVAVEGEWPLIFFGGRYSHAASKRVDLPQAGAVSGLYAPETVAPHRATVEQVGVATAALDVVTARFGTPPYTRVDVVKDDDGAACVLEVELVEPSLFLVEGGPAAAQRLVDALAAPRA